MKLPGSFPKALLLIAGAAIFAIVVVVLFRADPAPRTEEEARALPETVPTNNSPDPGIANGAAASPGGEDPVVTFTPAGAPPPVKILDPSQWEARIDELLSNRNITPRAASRELFAMAGDSKGPGQLRIDAAEHGFNLLDDENYLEDALALATNPRLPEEIYEILFADLHNRDESVSVPVAERIAKTPGHPLAEDARDFADFFMDDPPPDRSASTPATPAAPPAPAGK